MNPAARQFFLNHRLRLSGTGNMPTTPVQPPSGQAGPSALPDVPGNHTHEPASLVPPTVQPGQHNEPQTTSIMTNESEGAAADGSQHEGGGSDAPGAQVRRGKKTDLTEEQLQSRRELAEERIRRGGWRPDVAEMAIQVTQAYVWNDAPSTVWNVSLFLRRAEGLGEQCSNMKKIRRVLDSEIHRFIAIHAMQKNFQVPRYLVRKANRRGGDNGFKYPWFRSFIREYQGLPRDTEESLVQPYRERVDEPARGGDHGGIRVATPAGPEPAVLEPVATEPAAPEPDVPEPAVPEAAAPAPSRARAVSEPNGVPRQPTLANNERRRKRQRALHGRENPKTDNTNNPAKKVKTEPTGEDDLIELQDTGYEATTTSGAGAQDAAGSPPLTYDIRGVPHAGKRTLTVFFHGMTAEGAEGSETHVQVYVPRTSSGVTINFL